MILIDMFAKDLVRLGGELVGADTCQTLSNSIFVKSVILSLKGEQMLPSRIRSFQRSDTFTHCNKILNVFFRVDGTNGHVVIQIDSVEC